MRIALLVLTLLAFSLPALAQGRLLIPHYSYPGVEDPGSYGRTADISRVVPTTVIINPCNGPADPPDVCSSADSLAHRAATDTLRTGDPSLRLLGYVATGYLTSGTTAAANAVRAKIDLWDSLYTEQYRPEGLFFDEASASAAYAGVYRDLCLYAKSKGFSEVVINPGTTFDAGYLAGNDCDAAVAFEDYLIDGNGDWSTYQVPSALQGFGPERLAVLLHDVDGEAAMLQAVQDAVDRGFGLIYVTDDVQRPLTPGGDQQNPWNQLATYAEAEAARLGELTSNVLVTSPLATAAYAWGDPIQVRWDSTTVFPNEAVRIAILCDGQPPLVRFASTPNDGAQGFLVPSSLGVQASCTAEVAVASDLARRGESGAFAVQDSTLDVEVTSPARPDRYGLQDPITWRWTPGDIPTGSKVRLSILCPTRPEWVRFTASTNDGVQGVLLPADFGAHTGCHAQVQSSLHPEVYGRSGAFEVLDQPLPSVEITAPQSGTVVTAGQTYTIQWSTLSTDASVSLRILLDDRSGAQPSVRLAQTLNDGAFTWSVPSSQLPGSQYRVRITGLAQDGTRIRDVSELFTIAAPAAAGTDAGAAPERLTLAPVSPNPVQNRATVRVGVPAAGPLHVTLYDVTGRRVARLADGETRLEGWHRFSLDTDALASGVYLLRVRTETASETQTVRVVR